MPIGMTERMLNFNISFQIKELAPYILHPKWPMTLGFLYFYVMNLSINPLSYYHYWYSIRPSLESKSLSKLTAEYFWHDHSTLWNLPCFMVSQDFQFIWHTSCFRPGISHLSRSLVSDWVPPGKTLSGIFACNKFIGDCLQNQYLRGSDRNRTRQSKEINYSAPTANPTASAEDDLAFQVALLWGKRAWPLQPTLTSLPLRKRL